MQRRRFAWILLPAIIIVVAVLGVLLSSFQKEAGMGAPRKGGVATTAAAAEAEALAAGTGASGYDAFSKSLTVAVVAARNMPVSTAAEFRLQVALTNAFDCLAASREAWQAQLEDEWDPGLDGSADFWRMTHPALTESPPGAEVEDPAGNAGAALSSEQVRAWARGSADLWLQKAVDLAS
jgi:hypothetical protein